MWTFIKERMKKYPQSAFKNDIVTYTYSQIADLVETHGARLLSALPPGAKCAVLCDSEVNAAVMILACWCARMIPVPLSNQYGNKHCEAIINLTNPNIIIIDHDESFDIFSYHMNSQVFTGEPDLHIDQNLADVALIMCTSGTTGVPKGVMITTKGLKKNLLAIDDYFGIMETDILMIARPLYHCAVLTGEFLISLYNGADIIFFDQTYSPAILIDYVIHVGATVLCGTPTLFSNLSLLMKRHTKTTCIKKAALIGECLTKETAVAIRTMFPQTDILNVYGLTEASPRVTHLPPEYYDLYPESVGIPLKETKVIIVDAEHFAEQPVHTQGLIFVQSPSIMKGYYRDEMTLIISMCFLISIDWRLAVFAIAAVPLTFYLDSIVSRKEKILNEKNRENTEQMSSWLHTSVQGWREIKALNLVKRQTRKYVHYRQIGARHNSKWINCWTARELVIPKIKDEFFMRFGLYLIGGFLIIRGELQVSELLVFAIYFEMLSNAIKTISTTDAELQANMPFTDRLITTLDFQQAEEKGGIVPDHSNTIALNDVSFSYPNTQKGILKHVNVTINKGERVAIIGKSGCGKTTLLKLITGMIIPDEGLVSFSGIDLLDIDIIAMHRRIGFVMQENMLINTTIRDNLLYGKENASEEEINEACEKAYILELIEKLPEGLDTIIGEKGIILSGGQRQRIALARLFLLDVDIFIFDEATSALDQYSENIVYDAIRNISKEKTIIVVAHRESSIALCDRRIYMEALSGLPPTPKPV